MPTFNAANATQLLNALASAKGGDAIVLAGGDYGDVSLSDAAFSRDVTIRSADADDPASFSTLRIWRAENLTLDGIEVKFTPDMETQSFFSAVEIFYSENVNVINSRLVGGPAVNGLPQDAEPGTSNPTGSIIGLPTARAVTVRESDGVVIENTEITEFGSGIVGISAHGLQILSSELHGLRTTALRGSDFQDLVMDGNHIHSSKPWKLGGVGDHANFIHPWTSAAQTTPSENITITDNFLEIGTGGSIMGIYLDDDRNALGYKNVLIEGNTILTGAGQGILFEHVDGARVANNALLQPFGEDKPPLFHLRQDSRNVEIVDNILSGVVVTSQYASSIVESGSLALQWEDRFSPDHYINALIDPLQDVPDIDALRAVPGGIVEDMDVGPDMMRLDRPASGLDGYIEAERGSGFGLSNYPFDATNIWGPEGRVNTAGASVTWDFGDGSAGRGLVMEHHYEESGTYVVTADIRLADGRTVSLERTVEAESSLALQAGFEGGFGDETKTAVLDSVDSAVRIVNGPDGKAVDLNGGDIVYDVDTQFFGNPEYSVTFDFKRDGTETARLFNLAANLVFSVTANAVYVTFTTDQESARVKVGNLGIDDMDWHSLAFTFSGESGNAILYIDGEEVGRESGFEGHVQNGYSTQDLRIGDGFTGLIDNLVFLRGALSAADVKAGRIPQEAAPPASASGGEPVRAPSTPTPAPAPAPVASELDLDAAAAAIASKDYAGLAADTGRTLVTDGRGSAGDEVVLAGSGGWLSASSNGGDDALIGNAADNWLVAGSGSDVMYGGAGSDDFRFAGRDVSDAGSDAILDLDFGAGDRIVLTGYESGTFSGGGAGVNVFSGGTAAIIGSMAGLERLADASSDVTLDSGTDGLTLGIDQAGGAHDILLADLSSASGGEPVRAPSTPTPAPAPAPVASELDLDAAAAIASKDYAGLAADTGRTLVTDGRGSAGDEVVLAGSGGWLSASSNGGDDALIGNAADNWLVAGSGSDVMYGGAGSDDFRFAGRDVSDAGSDAILDLDFGAGDRIVLTGYESGTFSGGGAGVNVFSGGTAAIIGSMAGLERLADASSDVTLDSGTDGLTLGIDQAGGAHDILLADLSSASGGEPVRAPSTPTPAPAPAPVASELDLDAAAAAIASKDYAGLAADTGRTLVTDGRGSAGDEVVLAGSGGWLSASSNGGDDALIGNAADNWLVAGSGSDVMYGGAGSDDFRFAGRDVSDAGSDAILDLDFGAGDRIVLTGYESGTFSGGGAGVNVFSGGTAAIIGSMAGLERLADASSDVTLDSGTDGLTLGIDQSGGLQDILLV